MFVFGGVRAIGRVDECDGSYVVTQFVHINFLPLIPLRSELRVATGEHRPIPLHPVSVIAAYLRTVPLLLAAALLGSAFWWRQHPPERLFAIAAAAVAGLCALVGFALGRVSREEAAKRRALAEYVGAAVDLRLVKPELPALRESLQNAWDEAAGRAGAGAQGYRSTVTLDGAADLEDDDALRLAFALARVEATLAEGGTERARFDAIARRVWDKRTALGAYTPARALASPSSSPDRRVP